jgi:hypothetical protein
VLPSNITSTANTSTGGMLVGTQSSFEANHSQTHGGVPVAAALGMTIAGGNYVGGAANRYQGVSGPFGAPYRQDSEPVFGRPKSVQLQHQQHQQHLTAGLSDSSNLLVSGGVKRRVPPDFDAEDRGQDEMMSHVGDAPEPQGQGASKRHCPSIVSDHGKVDQQAHVLGQGDQGLLSGGGVVVDGFDAVGYHKSWCPWVFREHKVPSDSAETVTWIGKGAGWMFLTELLRTSGKLRNHGDADQLQQETGIQDNGRNCVSDCAVGAAERSRNTNDVLQNIVQGTRDALKRSS